jgi:hypothetical protein
VSGLRLITEKDGREFDWAPGHRTTLWSAQRDRMDDWSLLPHPVAVREPALNHQRPLTQALLDTSRPFMDDTGRLIAALVLA